ncbi:MAG: transposase [Pseudoalteromonas rhizosphaerae]|jgi:transposase|uniref:Transposase n=1 Tax=Pseudoalteromonas neustonica TaxID=1840331 RepID=A0ABY3FGI2_9GAMM|nr:transposase [Pseudoalteromonas neustonica]TVU85020.1 transposase [Pseudoalteromonas neustonica]
MAHCNLVAIDLAKNTFQAAQFKGNKLMSNKSVNRQTLLELLVQAKPSVVAMEACASAQHFARTAQSFGHDVILLGPLFVKAFRQGQKQMRTMQSQ